MGASNSIIGLQAQVATGNQAAYAELFALFYNKLLGFANAIVKNNEDAGEVVNDVFIKLWRARATIEKIDNLQLYLYKATRNTCLNYLAKNSRHAVKSLDDIDLELKSPVQNPEEALITKEMNHRLYMAINSLPPRCKMIFKLIKEDGLSYKETASLLNLSVSTVDNQLVLALKKLSKELFYSFQK
jgi:RNA polymerase sigma-70 factor (family 1)